MRCLIAERDPVSKLQLKAILSPYGSCTFASGGREALEAFLGALQGGRRFDLVCLDLKLPDLDGHGVLKGIREMERSRGLTYPNEVPIIITTGYLSPREMIGAYYYGGCTDFLVRPFKKKTLVELLISYGLAGADVGSEALPDRGTTQTSPPNRTDSANLT